jgi:hypothetical protein
MKNPIECSAEEGDWEQFGKAALIYLFNVLMGRRKAALTATSISQAHQKIRRR